MKVDNILLIEDDPVWLWHTLMKLSQLGYNDVDVCRSINDVNYYLQKKIPDLIIADVLIDKSTIFDIYKKYSYTQIPTIFITASEDKAFYEQAKIVAIFRYLVRPFKKLTLLSAIDFIKKHGTRKLPKYPQGISIKNIYNKSIVLMETDIELAHAEINYCLIHTATGEYRVKMSLTELINNIGINLLQVNRSTLVNYTIINDVDFKNKTLETKYGVHPIGLHYINSVKTKLAKECAWLFKKRKG